jgi:type IV pilus assembly protein PilM
MGLFSFSTSIVGLDIGVSSVTAVEFTRKGKSVVVTGYGQAEVKESDPTSAVEEALDAGNITTRKVVTAVSGRSVIVKYVSMIKMPDGELKQTMGYELDKYIPFPVDECVYDCQRIRTGGEEEAGNQMKVLIVAVKRNLIQDHYNFLDKLGLVSKIIDVDAFALGNAYDLGLELTEKISEETTALIDIGASKTNINIMSGRTSLFTREIYIGGNDMTEAVAKRFGESADEIENMKRNPGEALEPIRETLLPVLEDIGNEVRLSFDYYENQFDQAVRKVLVSGGVARYPGLVNNMSQIFGVECATWDPTESLNIDGSRVDIKAMKDNFLVLPVAVGLASRIRDTIR